MVDRGGGARVRTVYRGNVGWFHAEDRAFGLAWSNLYRQPTRLASPLLDGELPAWAEPPAPPLPEADFLRIGTLAVGWPMPALVLRWTVTDPKRLFPVAAELDDQDTSIAYAAETAVYGNRGRPTERWIHWPGLAVDVVFFSAIWAGPFALAFRLVARGRKATPPAASAAGR